MGEQKVKKEWYKRWWAITIFVLIGLSILGSLVPDDNSSSTDIPTETNTQNTQQNTEEVTQTESNQNTQTETSEPEKIVEKDGIGVTRSYLIDIFENPDLGYSFEEGVPVEDQPNYVGSNDVGSIQLIGPEEELTEAAIMIALGSDTGSNTLALVNLVGFANVIDSSSTDWVQQQFEIITETPNDDYKKSKIIGKRVFRISYSPIQGMGTLMTLTVEPA